MANQTIIQFIKFGIVGGVNTVLSYVIYFIGVRMGFHYAIANFTAFMITVFISYLLNGMFVFRGEGQARFDIRALLKVYASYSLTSLFLATALLWFEVDLLGLPEEIGPIINLFITVPINFLMNKFWAYRKKNKDEIAE